MRHVAAAAGVASAAFLPAATGLRPVRRLLSPALPTAFLGVGRTGHVALTYDDGPDARSTPQFLDLLARHEVRATFFLLGEHVGAHRALVAEMAAAGHELAVHGWDHTCVVLKRPGRLREEVARTRDLLEDVGGRPVRWYRPPYGVSSTASLLAARSAGLSTTLWTAWGRDWEARATDVSIAETVRRQLVTWGPARPGGTVLLHDSDRTSAPGSWWRTLGASQDLLGEWRDAGLAVGTLGAHLTVGTLTPRPA